MVTLLHTADTHVGYRQYHRPEREADFRDAFYQVIDEAIEREVDAVVHAGDLFDSSRPGIDALSDALEGLKRLREADIPFLSIVGNHDGTRDRQWLDVFASLGLAIRLDENGFSIRSERENEREPEDGSTGSNGENGCHLALYGLDHVEPGKRDRLDYAFDPERATAADAVVLVAHGLFKPFPNGDWDARAICRQSTVEFDAILAGDDHTNQETTLSEFGTLLTYPGSTERTAADQREPRGYDLVSVSAEGEIGREFRKLDTRPFVYVDVELSEDEGLDRVLDALGKREAEAAAERDGSADSEESADSRENETETESGFADRVVVVTLTGAGERVSSGPVEEFGLERDALTVRVNDRREHSEELHEYDEVAFADPERAVEERLETTELSENGRAVEEVVRDTEIPESNVTSVVERRVREWLDEPIEAFERPEPADDDSSKRKCKREDGESSPGETVASDGESKRASASTETGGSETDEGESNGAGSVIDPDSGPAVADSEPEHTGARDGATANGGGSRESERESIETDEAGEPDENGKPEPSDGNESDERTTQATLWD